MQTIKFALRKLIVRPKYSLTRQKWLQKVFLIYYGRFQCTFLHNKSLQKYDPLTRFFSPRWLPRWSPTPINGHNSVTINLNLMMLSIPMFWGQIMLDHYFTQKLIIHQCFGV